MKQENEKQASHEEAHGHVQKERKGRHPVLGDWIADAEQNILRQDQGSIEKAAFLFHIIFPPSFLQNHGYRSSTSALLLA